MEKSELLDKVSKLKIQKQSYLNDTFLWVKLAKEAIEQLPTTQFEFDVPSTKEASRMKTVRRNNPKSLKERVITKDIYVSAFISIVANIEDYFSKIIEWILLTDNERIKCTITGVSFIKDISIVDFISKDKNELISEIVHQRLNSLFYATPQKQLEYFERALDIKIDEESWKTWIEIKARRDLWVHNDGAVNQIYINKTGKANIYKLNDIALISNDYFSECISKLKAMLGRIDKNIQLIYR